MALLQNVQIILSIIVSLITIIGVAGSVIGVRKLRSQRVNGNRSSGGCFKTLLAISAAIFAFMVFAVPCGSIGFISSWIFGNQAFLPVTIASLALGLPLGLFGACSVLWGLSQSDGENMRVSIGLFVHHDVSD